MSWYMTVLKRYAEFEGRASRSEFWYFNLFNIIAFVVAGNIGWCIGRLVRWDACFDHYLRTWNINSIYRCGDSAVARYRA